jgi:hypothetical protein
MHYDLSCKEHDMREEVASLPVLTSAVQSQNYTTVQTMKELIARLQHLITTRSTQFALVTVVLYFSHLANRRTNSTGDTQELVNRADESLLYFLGSLRPLVRKTDQVFLLNHTMYFALPDADLYGGEIVQNRLWEALMWRVHNVEANILCPRSISIGYSVYPTSDLDIEQCITEAGITREEFDLEPLSNVQEIPIAQDSDLSALARQLGIPYLALLPRELPDKVWQLISPALARELQCCPIGRSRDILTVAMSDPQDSQALDRLRCETGLHIFPVLVHPRELQTVLDQLV